MEQSIISKIKEKGIIGILNSIRMRFLYTFITPWFTMHSSVARLIWRLLQCLPIKKNLVIFSSEPDFCDNSWALYQYLRANRPQCRFVWMVTNPEEFSDKADERTSFVTFFGHGMHVKAIYYFATARWNFFTHYTFNPYIPRKGQTVINLWHGTGVKDSKIKLKEYYDWILTTGNAGIEPVSRSLGCSTIRMLPLGYPRNDILLNNLGLGTSNPFCPNGDISKVVFWMPTFRKSINKSISELDCDTNTGFPLLETDEDIANFNSELKRYKVVVIAKIHHLQAEKDWVKNIYSHFIIITDEMLKERGYQLYQIVGKSDALLTDFSSIMVDYLLTNKPMGFVLSDLYKYEKSRGLLFEDVRKVMMGEHIYTKEQLLLFIEHVAIGLDEYKNKREEQILRVHNASDGTACKNIVDYFGI